MSTQRRACFLTSTFSVWYRSACRPSLSFGTHDTWTAVFDTNSNLLVWLHITTRSFYKFLRLACSVIHAWGLQACDAGVSLSSRRPFRKKSYWFCQNSDERAGWREREEKKSSLKSTDSILSLLEKVLNEVQRLWLVSLLHFDRFNQRLQVLVLQVII